MSSSLKRALLIIPCVSVFFVACQTALEQPSKEPKTPATEAIQARVDRLGRDTPFGTIFGFLQAAHQGNIETASEYLQLAPGTSSSDRENLARKLQIVIDRSFVGSLKDISKSQDGNLQPGGPPNVKTVGRLATGDLEADLTLVRVDDASGSGIWLITQGTLDRASSLYDQLEVRPIEKQLPHVLVQTSLLGTPLWQWLAALLAIPLAALCGWVLMELFAFSGKLWGRRRHQPLTSWSPVSRPVWLLCGTLIHAAIVSYLRISLLLQHYYRRVVAIVVIVAITWLMLRIIALTMRRLRDGSVSRGNSGAGSLAVLGERILKVIVVILAVFIVLGIFGFNLTTLLAGLGIGGLAVALAAQKTLENLFGGVSLLVDEVIRVGDLCRIGEHVGTVEDISLRSTRIRTAERSEISIPNGNLATVNLENLSRRDKILFIGRLSLRSDTPADRLRSVLAEGHHMLVGHPKVDAKSARIRLAELGQDGLNLELHCYVLTTDQAEFAIVREDLLLRMMDIVTEAGSSLALPCRMIYAGSDLRVDKEKTQADGGKGAAVA